MHPKVYYKRCEKWKTILCDKINNILGKWGCKEYKKRKFGKQLGKPGKNFQNIKDLEKNGENHLKSITRKDLIIRKEMLRKIHQKTKANAMLEMWRIKTLQ